MKKLHDYSGQFIPGLNTGDFSRDALAGLLDLYGRLYRALDGYWYLTVKERVGNQEALASDIAVWEKMCKKEVQKIAELLNIRGNDVTALMKAIQVVPWFQNNEFQIDIKDQNKAVFTVTRCPTLIALEREGEGREKEICKVVEPITLECYASFFSEDIKIKCLKAPPRKTGDKICCRWEFSLAI